MKTAHIGTVPVFRPDRDAPDPATLAAACDVVAAAAAESAAAGPWRSGAFAALARAGMLAGFVPVADGGSGAGEAALVRALVAVADRCLTTALAVTQWASAVRIIIGGPAGLRAALLPPLARGETYSTVGIAQLTTSRQHTGAALVARRDTAGWRLVVNCAMPTVL